MPGDRYAEYYAAKLWQLVPAVYRSLDVEPDYPALRGPLREIVNRIGAQAAVVRRSIDRMWEDQSIESCDDWIIPYIGDLLATRLVACLDARAQRVDVAKTIYYRRRKGTVGLLEELASDIAGRDARVVEFFRHLGRTRHNFDPPVELVPRPSLNGELSLALPIEPPPAVLFEGLAGVYSRTAMGGYADLRHHYGALRTQTAVDEFFYTADFRRGRQSVGWHNIPRLGVFVWWLSTYLVQPTTPVEYKLCPKQFTFDPTGREVPLFAASRRTGDRFGESWTSPDEWELPVPISQPLLDMRPDKLYADDANPRALAVLEGNAEPYHVMDVNALGVNVERGRFRLLPGPPAPAGGQVHVRYHYGFASEIGAGSYDQRRGADPAVKPPEPITPVVGGGNDLLNKVAAFGATGTLRIEDSLTYGLPGALGGAGGGLALAVVGRNQQRPVIRAVAAARPQWTIKGADETATLLLQGFHLAGADLVLTGKFDSVRIRCATLDPGTSASNLASVFAAAADGQMLWPTRLFIEASVKQVIIEQAITGPVRTRNGGAVETVTVTDSILQAIPDSPGGEFAADDFYDADALVGHLKRAAVPASAVDPLSAFVFGALSAATQNLIKAHVAAAPASTALLQTLTSDLNALLAKPVYQDARFAQVRLTPATRAQIGKPLAGAALIAFNRRLLSEAYPVALANVAIATSSGAVRLARTTVLGALAVHRLDASECILDDVAVAEDAQDGCVRFSAYADGSAIHQPYESVTIAPGAPLFRTREFPQPNYARLRESADEAITSGRAGASIIQGAKNGSEMGAFAREQIPLKRRGLAQKFAEFMPVGMVPVWIDAS